MQTNNIEFQETSQPKRQPNPVQRHLPKFGKPVNHRKADKVSYPMYATSDTGLEPAIVFFHGTEAEQENYAKSTGRLPIRSDIRPITYPTYNDRPEEEITPLTDWQ